jgi:hypothetical protein
MASRAGIMVLGGSGGGPAGRPPVTASAPRSFDERCERTVLTRAGDGEVDDVVVGPNVTVTPARAGSQPRTVCPATRGARIRDDPVELHRSTPRIRIRGTAALVTVTAEDAGVGIAAFDHPTQSVAAA